MKTYIELITPKKAKELLSTIKTNRPVSNGRVNHYSSIMKRGEWRTTHQGIAIDKNGCLIDGQHRLNAIVKANVSVTMSITEGLSTDTFKYMDVGYTRTAGNVFHIEGIPNAKNHAAGVSRYFSMKHNITAVANRQNNRTKTSNTFDDYLQFYYENAELLNLIIVKSEKYYRMYKLFSPTEIYGLMVYIMLDMGYTSDYVCGFFESLYTKNNNSKSNAPELLFQKLINNLAGNLEIKPRAKTALFIKAFNYYVKGKKIKRLNYNPDREKFPLIIKKEY